MGIFEGHLLQYFPGFICSDLEARLSGLTHIWEWESSGRSTVVIPCWGGGHFTYAPKQWFVQLLHGWAWAIETGSEAEPQLKLFSSPTSARFFQFICCPGQVLFNPLSWIIPTFTLFCIMFLNRFFVFAALFLHSYLPLPVSGITYSHYLWTFLLLDVTDNKIRAL